MQFSHSQPRVNGCSSFWLALHVYCGLLDEQKAALLVIIDMSLAVAVSHDVRQGYLGNLMMQLSVSSAPIHVFK